MTLGQAYLAERVNYRCSFRNRGIRAVASKPDGGPSGTEGTRYVGRGIVAYHQMPLRGIGPRCEALRVCKQSWIRLVDAYIVRQHHKVNLVGKPCAGYLAVLDIRETVGQHSRHISGLPEPLKELLSSRDEASLHRQKVKILSVKLRCQSKRFGSCETGI